MLLFSLKPQSRSVFSQNAKMEVEVALAFIFIYPALILQIVLKTETEVYLQRAERRRKQLNYNYVIIWTRVQTCTGSKGRVLTRHTNLFYVLYSVLN